VQTQAYLFTLTFLLLLFINVRYDNAVTLSLIHYMNKQKTT